MVITSGLLLFRKKSELQFFIVHPGGPFFARRDKGVWSITKGVPDHGELIANAAIREFKEETGCKIDINSKDLILLGTNPYNNKLMHCFAFEKDLGEIEINSNSFNIEWPPKSGKMQSFPEVDKGGYYNFVESCSKLHPNQVVFLERLKDLIDN